MIVESTDAGGEMKKHPNNDYGDCRKCGGKMKKSVATGQTYTGVPDFAGSDDVCTFSPGGSGFLMPCAKCTMCGWSVTI